MVWFNLTLTPKISSFIVAIDIGSLKQENKFHYNSATALYFNSNLVSIMQFIMIVFIKKCCLHFENLNVHLMIKCILTNLISTQWPEIFVSCKVFIDRLTICCMQTEMLALQDE